MVCTWKKVNGRYMCQAVMCEHWTEEGCLLGKVSLSCDNDECIYHLEKGNHCACMDVHLDADGKCLGVKYAT